MSVMGQGVRRPRRLVLHVVLVALAVAMLYPLVWMVASSVKPENEIFTSHSLLPTRAEFANYAHGWSGLGTSFGVFLGNSALIAALSIVGNLVSCSLVAYAIARLEFRGRRLIFAIMMGTVMLPQHVVLVPQYILFVKLGLTDTMLPMVLPKFLAVDAFFVFLMVQFLRGIPREMDEAAMVDGAGPWRIYRSVVLPQMRPALVTAAIFTFIWTWNDFFTQLLYLSSPAKLTVPLGLQMFLADTGQSSWGAMFAMTTLSLLPVVLVFVCFQKLIVEGASTSGLK
ncbi:carbohydrate ABC transporter permease [Actinocatenispora rupis]|uniref:ABC transporter permease n=1 Tax=Actinocatenispora rupis TaxID=519421 RepID=A0A8J3J3S9_9ACTN|nr:carbohydrate ABC transporter permease [Actinocatenispora rupis]GID09609.1 ABC transporter permease [Actinocatenispora rupis]